MKVGGAKGLTCMPLAEHLKRRVHLADVIMQRLNIILQIADELQLAHAAALRALPVRQHPLVLAASPAAANARTSLLI